MLRILAAFLLVFILSGCSTIPQKPGTLGTPEVVQETGNKAHPTSRIVPVTEVPTTEKTSTIDAVQSMQESMKHLQASEMPVLPNSDVMDQGRPGGMPTAEPLQQRSPEEQSAAEQQAVENMRDSTRSIVKNP